MITSNKKYYIFTNNNNFSFLGNFIDSEHAYEYAEYIKNLNFLCIFSEEDLNQIKLTIEKLTEA